MAHASSTLTRTERRWESKNCEWTDGDTDREEYTGSWSDVQAGREGDGQPEKADQAERARQRKDRDQTAGGDKGQPARDREPQKVQGETGSQTSR